MLQEVYVSWLKESVEKLEQQDRDFAKFRSLLPQQAGWTALHHAAYTGKLMLRSQLQIVLNALCRCMVRHNCTLMGLSRHIHTAQHTATPP